MPEQHMTGIAGLLAGYGDERLKRERESKDEELAEKQRAYSYMLARANDPNITLDEQKQILNDASALWDKKGSGGLFGIRALGGKKSKTAPRLGDLLLPDDVLNKQTARPMENNTGTLIEPPPGADRGTGPIVADPGVAPEMTERYGSKRPGDIAADRETQQFLERARMMQPLELQKILATIQANQTARRQEFDYEAKNTWDVERILQTRDGKAVAIQRNKTGDVKQVPLNDYEYQLLRDPTNPIEQRAAGLAAVIGRLNPNLSPSEVEKRANTLVLEGFEAEIQRDRNVADAPPPGAVKDWEEGIKDFRARQTAAYAAHRDAKELYDSVPEAEQKAMRMGAQATRIETRIVKLQEDLESLKARSAEAGLTPAQVAQQEIQITTRLDREEQKLDDARAKSQEAYDAFVALKIRRDRALKAIEDDYGEFLKVTPNGKVERKDVRESKPKAPRGGARQTASPSSNGASASGNSFLRSKLDIITEKLNRR